LIAFWQFLKREYGLANADDAIAYLQKLDPDHFIAEMNNPANFGMARSVLQGGLQSGFDMTTQEGLDAYMGHYNSLMAQQGDPGMVLPESELFNSQQEFASQTKKKAKNKRRNALAKASRKRNRKKKK